MEVNESQDDQLDTSNKQKQISIDNSINDSLENIEHELTINCVENNK